MLPSRLLASARPDRRLAIDRSRFRADEQPLAALAVVLLAWFVGLYLVRGFAFPVGPDAPVYLWWTRLAGNDGLSAVQRPGIAALLLTLTGTLHLPLTAVVGALESVLATAIGLGSAALLRRAGSSRGTWVLGGLLAGTFAVHLAAGYLANLAFAAMLVAAAVLLADGGRRAAIAGALLLAAGGLAHPLFFALGAAILLLTAAAAWRDDRAGSVRILVCVAGGAGILGLGLLALTTGPEPLAVDTSRDAFLRRAGLADTLRSAYLDRLVHRSARYVQWVSVPLAIAGLTVPRGFARRFLETWGVATIAGVAVGAATGWFPPDRFITFGLPVPILAAVGLVRLFRALSARRLLAIAVTGALTAAMLAGAFIAWGRQEPFMSTLEVRRATAANAVAAVLPQGTVLAFVVNGDAPTLSFFATRVGNVVRAALPPDRIRDAVVSVPAPPTGTSVERATLSALSDRDLVRTLERPRTTFIIAPFARREAEARRTALPASFVGTGVSVSPEPAPIGPPVEPLTPTSGPGVLLAALGVAFLLGVSGFGWARAIVKDGWSALALSPAVGAAAYVLLAVLLERLGMPLTGAAGPTAVSALAALGGYATRFVGERRVRVRPPA